MKEPTLSINRFVGRNGTLASFNKNPFESQVKKKHLEVYISTNETLILIETRSFFLVYRT